MQDTYFKIFANESVMMQEGGIDVFRDLDPVLNPSSNQGIYNYTYFFFFFYMGKYELNFTFEGQGGTIYRAILNDNNGPIEIINMNTGKNVYSDDVLNIFASVNIILTQNIGNIYSYLRRKQNIALLLAEYETSLITTNEMSKKFNKIFNKNFGCLM